MYHKNGIHMVISMLAIVFVWEYMVYADAMQDKNGLENEYAICETKSCIIPIQEIEKQQCLDAGKPVWYEQELRINLETENRMKHLTQENSQVLIEKNIGVTGFRKCKVLEKHYQYSVSEAERQMLERIVEAEACGEDMDGKKLVANVVLNRVQNKSFPDSIEEVIFQKDGGVYQFSPVYDGRYYSVSVSQESREAVEEVLLGDDNSEGALYFMSRNYADSDKAKWFDRHLTKLFAYGGHEFFR